jgi:hypothetical protein
MDGFARLAAFTPAGLVHGAINQESACAERDVAEHDRPSTATSLLLVLGRRGGASEAHVAGEI